MKSKHDYKQTELKKECHKALTQALHFSKEGADLAMEAALEELKSLSKENGLKINEKVIQKIRDEGYENAYLVALNETRQFAESGNIAMVKVSMDNLRDFASKANHSIEESFIQELKILAYKNAYRSAVKEAMQFAQLSKEAILGSSTVKKYVKKPANALQQVVLETFKNLFSTSKSS